MGISLVHDLHTKIGTVDNVGPGVDDTALGVDHRLVEVESVQVEGHGGNSHGGQPDTHDRPGGQEEVKGAGVIERSVLEDETSEITVCSHDVHFNVWLGAAIAFIDSA